MCVCMNLICQHRRLRWCHLAQLWHPDGVSGLSLIQMNEWAAFFPRSLNMDSETQFRSRKKKNQNLKRSKRGRTPHDLLSTMETWAKLNNIIYIEGKREQGKTLTQRETGGIVHTRERRSEAESPAGQRYTESQGGERERRPETADGRARRNLGRERWTEIITWLGLSCAHGCRSANKQRVREMQRFSESWQYYCWPCRPRYLRLQRKKLHF